MKKGAVWPFVIAGALALHVIASLVVVFFATSDASYAVEDDYYQKAMDWDKKRAQDHTNESLGWSFDFAVAPPERPGDQPRLEVVVADREDRPIADATVSVEAFHNSRGDDILRAVLDPSGTSGSYEASLPMGRNGRWELRFTVDRGEQRFTHTESRHLFVEGSWQ